MVGLRKLLLLATFYICMILQLLALYYDKHHIHKLMISIKENIHLIKRIFLLFLILSWPSMVACSNVFYLPSKEIVNDPKDLGLSYEDVYVESKDGAVLHGWFFPSESNINETGTVIQFHGNAENISTHFLSMAWIVKHGYNLFIFDYRGYGRSEGSPSQAKIHEDALAALEYAIKIKSERNRTLAQSLNNEKDQPKHKLVAYGQSLGGTILLRAINDLNQKSEINAMIIESAFPSYQQIVREKLSNVWFTWPFQHLAYALVSDQYAPKEFIGHITPIPLLVIHGDRDKTVPIHHGKEIHTLANEPKFFWLIEGGRHIAAMSVNNGAYRSKLLEFLSNL